jgi:hypothetical protein
MTRDQLIEALTNLEKVMRIYGYEYNHLFRLTTRMITAGLTHSTDESIEVDGIAHLEQAKRLLGAQS